MGFYIKGVREEIMLVTFNQSILLCGCACMRGCVCVCVCLCEKDRGLRIGVEDGMCYSAFIFY